MTLAGLRVRFGCWLIEKSLKVLPDRYRNQLLINNMMILGRIKIREHNASVSIESRYHTHCCQLHKTSGGVSHTQICKDDTDDCISHFK